MLLFARNLILILWVIWLLYWVIAARGSKPVRQREGPLARAAFLAQALLTAALLAPLPWSGWLALQLIGGGWTRYWIAVSPGGHWARVDLHLGAAQPGWKLERLGCREGRP